MPVPLAIVIPAFKSRYFNEALESLASQTNKNFKVYIGDDNSPEDLFSIVNTFKEKLDISYTKFENNIGSQNLVNQWSRCVALSKEENWLWLFSDDDIAEADCVANFYKTLENDQRKFQVYRFNTAVIDKHSRWVTDTPVGPDEESSAEMAYNLLMGRRGNSMPDHIYSRQVYKDSGGYVFTEYAQAADWAMSILFSKAKGIKIIPGARMLWRYSGDNISSTASNKKDQMLAGHYQFISWVLKHFQYLKTTHGKVTYQMICDAARFNLGNVIIQHYRGLNLKQMINFLAFEKKTFRLPIRETISDLLHIKKYTLPPYFSVILKIRGRLRRMIKPA